ncbi:hypothetical protein AN478_12250 [Thiohalorhabdus denitrificans]|uniref:DUF2149 domain-containing protein n=1 Tax=Thiohalorhabdus denitrificans TaxID=381306 RepID=A0A0P9C2A5_9GAMM|nr:DUF2149 domain-containing protein [Thiohalorhabdus denitrificans]KPV39074.1 hypothetical protein AN478_12250 [Thiohalorhabdus denitrificans]SCX78309.1 hypothetical protein SAMN05661077_0406 [Thiohalorhabdus denitrificans]
MAGRDWSRGRFDEADAEPMGPMANLVDIMLVFAVGLIAALAASQGGKDAPLEELSNQEITKGRELPEVPEGMGGAGSGYEPMGEVYRDPETGKLIMIKGGGGGE